MVVRASTVELKGYEVGVRWMIERVASLSFSR